VDIIREMTKIAPALKAWRGPIVDLLNDNRLFNCHAELGLRWKPVMKALFDADKTAFPELLGELEPLLPLIMSSKSVDSQSCNGPVHEYIHK
jgi:hypothetical protein